MCGIAGFTHSKFAPKPERIRNITSALTHRGPDQQGVWESALASLGAVRLKIIDLDHGEQPMTSDDGDTVLVFNGEIYNNAELRRELERLGHRFRSRCDTETVLRAFLEWDVDAFRRMRGMFAAAFWTESQRRLVLVRDRVGIKPLYFARHGSDLYFGSTEGHPAPSRDRSPDQQRRPGSLSIAELRAGTAHAGGGCRKAPARALARMARRCGEECCVLEA